MSLLLPNFNIVVFLEH